MSKSSVGNSGEVYRKYTDEFRRDAVRMIESEGLTTADGLGVCCESAQRALHRVAGILDREAGRHRFANT